MNLPLPEREIERALIVVAKLPTPGLTKTRLSPPLSAEQASSLYEGFLLDTIDLIRMVPGIRPVIAYLPQEAAAYFNALAPEFDLLVQSGRDLGERLDHALSHYLYAGCRSAVILDSDSPTLPAEYLSMAFEKLDCGSDVVIGPCEDGGYYLIGLNEPHPALLRGVRMSTPQVTADTLAIAAREGLQVGMLPTWYDVDDQLSLKRLYADLSRIPVGLARNTRSILDQPVFNGIFAPSSGPVILPRPQKNSPVGS